MSTFATTVTKSLDGFAPLVTATARGCRPGNSTITSMLPSDSTRTDRRTRRVGYWVATLTVNGCVRVESDGSIEVMVEFPGLHPLAVAVTSGANPSKLFVTVVANVDIYALG